MEIAQRARVGAYQLMLTSDAVVSFAMGLFAPFWIIFIQDFGGSSSAFGFAVGLKMLAYSLVAYAAGALSDKLSRKGPIIAGRLASSFVVCSYPWTGSLSELYALQVFFGAAAAIDSTATAAFLGDITKRVSRGRDIGRFHAVCGIAGALAMMLGGVAVQAFGIEIIFYVVGMFFFASTLLVFFVEERRGA